MKRGVNLLPAGSQQLFEHQRLARAWSVIWLVVFCGLAVGYFSLELGRQRQARELVVAQADVAPIRQADGQARRLQTEGAAIRGRVEACRALEQTDVPLAILQVVGDCCHAASYKIELESLRMDESTAVKAPAGQRPEPRKQLLLTGTADNDARVSAFVSQLRASQAFHGVELEATQALTDQALSRRSFQIRCQQ